jgi:Protein of unknown function (DUF2934)
MPKKNSTTTTSKKTAPRLVANKTATATAASITEVVTEAQIAERAFHIYINEGCPDGRHLDHWFQAVSEFRV